MQSENMQKSDNLQEKTETKNEQDSLLDTMSDQDFKQKFGMYTSFIMEFYRVLMGSFLIIFVPQECNDHICTMTDNIATGDAMKDITFSFNVITFVCFLAMYYAELKRENKMITYLEVNPELPRDNEAVGEALVKLPVEKKNTILKLDKLYQRTGRGAMIAYTINVGLSAIVAISNYLDDKTITVLLTNAIFMALKLYDTKTITDTEENVFLSAYLTRRIQYNDVDPDKILKLTDNIVNEEDKTLISKNKEILEDIVEEVVDILSEDESNNSMVVNKDVESSGSNNSTEESEYKDVELGK